MKKTEYWADAYINKRCTAKEAIARIRPGQRVFIGSVCGEPQHLVKALCEQYNTLADVEVVRLMSDETTALLQIADRTRDQVFNIRSIYLGAGTSFSLANQMRHITPLNMSEVPILFKSRLLPLHVAMVQVSPPDDFGWMSLGVSVDITFAAAKAADVVIAQVNPKMPRVLGQSFIHVNDVDHLVEHEEDLISISPLPSNPVADKIGQHIMRLIQDGATLQIGLDANSRATAITMAEKNDLGIHTQFITDDIMHLYATGVVNNKYKGFNDGKMVASIAVGSPNLYEFLDDNPAVEFHPSDYVNDPFVIARHHRMVSLNVARCIDLTGQVSAEASAQTLYAGVSGICDFVRGARRAPEGKSILMLPSTHRKNNVSTIVPMLKEMPVVVPRGDIQWVVTEYGAVNLFGKSMQERAMAMISIAHPDFRDELLDSAKELGLVGKERTLGESIQGIYPVHLEETVPLDDDQMLIRPVKPVDERRIQEHYYNLDKKDIYLRFFREKSTFARMEMAGKLHIDYIKSLTLIAVVGEFGFDKVIAVAEYIMLLDNNMAEVGFSVSNDYQGQGIAKRMIRKLAQAARQNGISGFLAYTSSQNQAMIRLFRSLPYAVETSLEPDALCLTCRFDESAKPQ